MFGYIYKTTNLVNGKIYIGQHIASSFEPTKYLGSGAALKKAFNKYGKKNFKCELIATAENIDDLNALEIFYIAKYKACDQTVGYNLCPGGDNISGYKFTEEQLQHLSQSHIGHKPTPEAIKKQVDKCKGRITITNGTLIRLVPPEKLSEYEAAGWYKGRPKYARSQAITCYETGEQFTSISAAKKKYPSAGALWRCVHCAEGWTYNSVCAGYHWYLTSDEEHLKWLLQNVPLN